MRPVLKVQQITILGNIESCEKINLVIGANNTGKSTLLHELNNVITNVSISENALSISGITVEMSDTKNFFLTNFPRLFSVNSFKEIPEFNRATYRMSLSESNFWNEDIFNRVRSSDNEPVSYTATTSRSGDWNYFAFFTKTLVAFEHCAIRLEKVFSTTINSVLEPDNTSIGFLIRNKDILKQVQKNILDVFGIKIGFDNLVQGKKSLRIIPNLRMPNDGTSPETARAWETSSPLIESQGDGIQAYLKLVLSLFQPSKHITIIDEPESFLHPPQRRALGTLVSQLVVQQNKQVFISTHDPDFLRGVLNSGTGSIKIFNMTATNQQYQCQTLSPSNINNLITDRSNLITERILNSFFYKTTVICEAEDDRVFYENTSARYLWGDFQNTNFIGMNGKGIAIVVWSKLKKLNLNAKVILDIDFLLTDPLPQLITNAVIKSRYKSTQANLNKLFPAKSKQRALFKRKGIKYLHSTPLIHHETLQTIEDLKQYGIYIVPTGEFESWGQTPPKDLQAALQVINKKRKLLLVNFLKDILK
jgi:AAA15 family ATPase/GTPase